MQIQNNLRVEGNKVISYTTHVATIDNENGKLLVHGRWSNTTSRHINKVADMYDLTKEDADVPEEDKEESKPSGNLKMASTVAAMGEIIAGDTLKEKNDWKKRMLNTQHGLSFPDDFDDLPEEERKKRLDGAIKIGLETEA